MHAGIAAYAAYAAYAGIAAYAVYAMIAGIAAYAVYLSARGIRGILQHTRHTQGSLRYLTIPYLSYIRVATLPYLTYSIRWCDRRTADINQRRQLTPITAPYHTLPCVQHCAWTSVGCLAKQDKTDFLNDIAYPITSILRST